MGRKQPEAEQLDIPTSVFFLFFVFFAVLNSILVQPRAATTDDEQAVGRLGLSVM
jgi:hypothetical protein